MFSEQYRNDMNAHRLSEEASDRILDTLTAENTAPKKQPVLWRAVAVAAAVVLLVTAMVPFLKEKPPVVSFYPEWEDAPSVTVRDEKHLTYQEALSLIETLRTPYYGYVTDNEMLPEMKPAGDADGTDEKPTTATNTQYAAVDEADVVKVQNGHIYVLNRMESRLSVYRADGEKTTLCAVKKPSDKNVYLRGMYLTPSRLVVLYTCHDVMEATATADDREWEYSYLTYRTVAAIYDITDPASPHFLTKYGQDGELLDSRMVDGVLYLVSGHSVWEADKTDLTTFVPELYRDDTAIPLAESTLCAVSQPNAANYAVITAVSTWGDTARVSEKAVLGAGNSRIWSNGEHLMLMQAGERSSTEDDEAGHRVVDSCVTTDLTLFGMRNGTLTHLAAATLDGTLDGQFALDEQGGYFRIAASCAYHRTRYTAGDDQEYIYESNDRQQYNRLYVLDATLHEVGRIDNMAPDETVQSVRFDGDIGYVVTFRQTDPLFAIDLSDPQNPTVLSALKITGFSEYLHPFADGRLLGFGYAGTEDGVNGQLKLTMFDTTNKTDVTVRHALELPHEYVSSEALGDHHAILADTARSVVGLPVYTHHAELAYLLYRYSEADGFTPLARCDIENSEKSEFLRGIFIDGTFYAVHQGGVTVYDNTFSPIATV